METSQLYDGFSMRANGNAAQLSEALSTGFEANNLPCLV
jgi:hypothetical protein